MLGVIHFFPLQFPRLSNFSHSLTFTKRIDTLILEAGNSRGLLIQMEDPVVLCHRKEEGNERNGSEKPK